MMSVERQNIVGDISGFTLLELIAILLMVAILGAVALQKFGSPTSDYDLAGEAATLRGDLRYAQLRAMNDTVSWKVSINAAGYTLSRNDTPANLPEENSPTHAFADGVALNSPNVVVTFDSWGSPGGNDITISLASGPEAITFTIAKDTGFIP